MVCTTTKFALLCVVAVPAVAAAACSNAWENCSTTMCCQTPFFACVEKNQAQTKDGQFMPAYAQCRFGNATAGKSTCPCKNPPCYDYADEGKALVKLPWSCITLTGGCSKAYENCGPGQNLNAKQKKEWKGTPCCQWGCTCNYTVDWNAQCQPPAGMYACTKDAQNAPHKKKQQKQPTQKTKNDDDADDDDDADERLFSISKDEAPAPRVLHDGLWRWIAGSSVSLLVVAAVMVLRKRRIQRGEKPFFEEVGDESS